VAVTFESGSRLSYIEDSVFPGCSALSSLSIPCSVKVVRPGGC
jgi:hypothetical protein